MSAITTHVLDISKGRPAGGVPVVLERFSDEGKWHELGRGVTDEDGRCRNLLSPEAELLPGTYRLTFGTLAYFASEERESFYPEVAISFIVQDAAEHYHVPLLLSPYGFSTYRGS